MRGMNRLHNGVRSAAVSVVALCILFTLAFAQNLPAQDVKTGPVPIVGGFDKVKALPPGGPAPRMKDGHVDLTGRWYPNAAGRMLQVAYPVDKAAFQQFDPQGDAGGEAFLQTWGGLEIHQVEPLWSVRSTRYT